MGLKKNKPHHSIIGRRTGTNVVAGKLVSIKSDGLEDFNDYWTETDSDQTTVTNNSEQTLVSTNLSTENSDNTDSRRSPRSTRKNVSKKNEAIDNSSDDYSGQVFRKCHVLLSKTVVSDIIGKSNKIETSYLLNENSYSRNRTYLKELKLIEDCLSDCEKIPSVLESSKILSNTYAEKKRRDIPLLTGDANSENVSSHEINLRIKSKNNSDTIVDKVEVSPSKEKTNISFKETKKEKIHSSYYMRSSIRQYPGVLSNASSFPKYREKDKRRNSGVTALQGDMLNQREKIFFTHNVTLEKPERESAVKVNMQKTSKAESFIEGKRKMEASNTSEGRSCKFPHIECSKNKGNKLNSNKQPVMLPSEVQYQKGKNISRNNNASEILVSGQKETVNSSIEKSPKVSQHNMMQASNSQSSYMKTVKPLHSKRHKTFLSEAGNDNFHKRDKTSCHVRRSTRMRFPPLASWRNERPKFVKSHSEGVKCLGIDKGQPEDDYAYQTLKKRLYKYRKNQKLKASYKKGEDTIKKTTISDKNTGQQIQLYLHRPFSTCEWIKPNDESGNYTISKVFQSNLVNFGFLDIAAHSMKEKQYPLLGNIHFLVVKGTVDVVIASTSYTLGAGDSFIVPVDTAYSLINKASSKALLNFCIIKIPFFNYQEKIND